MNNEKEISFGAFDSELMHQEITIPEGFEATIEGDKIILTRKESKNEKIRKRLIDFFEDWHKNRSHCWGIAVTDILAWLEKQGEAEPKWCHHKVDLSGCSEEYRKAYYDGWNNCNQQHSQCKSESNDVVKCLINGMKFYYEDNEEATWGTEKFSMKVKDILSWLEKQGTSYTKKDVDDAYVEGMAFAKDELEKQGNPTDEDMKELLRTEYEKGRADAIAEMQQCWSDKEKQMFADIIEATKKSGIFKEAYKRELVDWLKSFKQIIGE